MIPADKKKNSTVLKMVLKKEMAAIRGFIIRQLRDEPDLSTLTIGILKKRYMAHVECDSLSPEAKKIMKKVVEEELMKMQENDKSESESEITKPPNKGKREREQKEAESEEEKQPTAKKSRDYLSSSSSDSEDDGDCKPKRLKQRKPQPGDAKQEMKESTSEKNGNAKQQNTSDDSSSEEVNESEESCTKSDSPEKTVKKKANTSKDGETRRIDASVGKKTTESDQESDSEKSEKSDKINDSESSDNEKEGNVLAEKKNDSSSDSSSLPSLEDNNKSGTEDARDEKKKKKRMKKDPSTRGQKDDDKAVVRFKRYIALCGVRRNYKKLLDGCRSTRSKVAVLKRELEDLGVHGKPSIEKCKKIRVKREEAQEVAELDIGNIITTEGRPNRRGTSARQERDPPISTYQRTLNSGSDSDHENNTDAGRRKMSDWTNLRGIISDDADSD